MVTKPITTVLYVRKIHKHLFAFFIQINPLHFLTSFKSVGMHNITNLIDNDGFNFVFEN